MQTAAPLHINQFYLGKCLGEGSFARVHYARRKRRPSSSAIPGVEGNASTPFKEDKGREEYAVKVVNRKNIERRNVYIKMILNEKKVHSHLCHENIVRLFATWVSQDHLFFLQELCSSNLRCILEALEGEEVLRRTKCAKYYLIQLLNALEYIHCIPYRVVHRDIKPENCLVVFKADEHQVKLADFGSAAVLDDNRDEYHEINFIGTPHYASPEALEELSMSTADDLWSFACILFEFVTNKLYYDVQQSSNSYCGVSLANDTSKEASLLWKEMLKEPFDERLCATDELDESNQCYNKIRDHAFFSNKDEYDEDIKLLAVNKYDAIEIDGGNPNWEFLLEEQLS